MLATSVLGCWLEREIGGEEGVWTVILAINGFCILGLFIVWPPGKGSALRGENSNLIGMGLVRQT